MVAGVAVRLAKDLITRGYSSKAAAAELKFATDAHFCREFKRVFGASPQTFAPNRMDYMSVALLDRDAANGRFAMSWQEASQASG